MSNDYQRCLVRWLEIPFSRRRLLAGATVLLMALLPGAGRTNSDETAPAGRRGTPVRLTLPAPTGPHAIGTVSEYLVEQYIAAGIISPALAEYFSRILDPNRAVAVQRAYIRAFFDRWLRYRDTQLLDGQAPQFPEIIFY